MRPSMLRVLVGLIVVGALLSGCARENPRVVLVPHTEPVQLAEDVRAYVYVETADGKKVKSDRRVTLAEGLWVGSANLD